MQPFLQGLLDSGKSVSQYYVQNERCGWDRLLSKDEKHVFYCQVLSQSTDGFEIVVLATPWSILVPGMNRFYTAYSILPPDSVPYGKPS